jgi:2,4-dienoyl-CoA reductase-like NADH-dependent reductase (Old Yellow Enzyme family)
MTSPAAIPAVEGEGEPQELSVRDIAGIVAAFAAAARRVRDAGFDGVEIHSAHAYLLDQFYSPLLNARADGYGGTLENRLRIHREVLAAVREAVGPDFTVGMRLGGCDYEAGGASIADAVEAARSLGLTHTTAMISIILPQAVKNILPALGNEFIMVVKETSLASTFFVGELMTAYLKVKGYTYLTMECLAIVGVLYFALTYILSKILKAFERRMKAHA